jgi:hypothetical protein
MLKPPREDANAKEGDCVQFQTTGIRVVAEGAELQSLLVTQDNLQQRQFSALPTIALSPAGGRTRSGRS